MTRHRQILVPVPPYLHPVTVRGTSLLEINRPPPPINANFTRTLIEHPVGLVGA